MISTEMIETYRVSVGKCYCVMKKITDMALKLLASATKGLNSPQAWSTLKRSLPPVLDRKPIESISEKVPVSTVAIHHPASSSRSSRSSSSSLPSAAAASLPDDGRRALSSSIALSGSRAPSGDDPNSPRIPMNRRCAFALFLKNKTLDVTQASALWKNMSIDERQPYLDMQLQDKERYENDMQEFMNLDSAVRSRLEKEKKKRQMKNKCRRLLKSLSEEDKKPRPPTSAFVQFYIDRYAEEKRRPDITQDMDKRYNMFSELTTEIGKEWRNLADEQKTAYLEDARRRRAEFDVKLLVWEKKMLQMGHTELVRQYVQRCEASEKKNAISSWRKYKVGWSKRRPSAKSE